MIYITKQLLDRNLKHFGFLSYDKEVLELINQALYNFVRSNMTKMMKGGRVVLPSDYFGVPSASHFENLTDHGANMSVTEHMIRPHIPIKDLGAASGGALDSCFTVTKKAVNYAIKEAMLVHKKPATDNVCDVLKEKFEKRMTAALKAAAKKDKEHLSVRTLRQIFTSNKYKVFL
jgi:hypothetical protein